MNSLSPFTLNLPFLKNSGQRQKMRVTTVILSCFAGRMAVQATSFVTVVKTVLEDKAGSSVGVSTPALDHKSFSELAKISRRDEGSLTETPSMTRIYITSPYTTVFEIPLTPQPAEKSKSEELNDEEGWRDITDTPTPASTPTTPAEVIQTITRTQSAAGAPVRNTGVPTIHPSVAAPTYTDIPSDWLPEVEPNVNPYMQPPLFPEIINPGYVAPTTSKAQAFAKREVGPDAPGDVLPSKSTRSTRTTKTTRSIKPTKSVKTTKSTKHAKSAKPTESIKPTRSVKPTKPINHTRFTTFTTSITSTRSTTYTTFTTWTPPVTSTKTPANACDIYPYPDGYCNASGTPAP
ncbi:hypothetical protein KCU77_g6535, partial [Aureobasidium melanogenum]